MTAPTIPPQQPEPERVCGNCEFFVKSSWSESRGDCFIEPHLPPALQNDVGPVAVSATHTCVLFRARKES